jgi:glycosyltransferase involved in cell wall biosynthesis
MVNRTALKKVAVIMRTKDRPLLLRRALKSVSQQSFSDYVLVIVNDGGSKKTVEDLLSELDSPKDNINVIHNENSLGMQAASNIGIKSSRSKYVVIHDDDDTWSVKFLEQTVNHLETTNSMGVVAATDLVVEKIENNSVKKISASRLHPELENINLYKMCFENYAAPINFIYRRSVFDEIGYYDESLGGVADWDFGLRFLLKYDIDYLKTSEALAFYHHRPPGSGKDVNSVFTSTHRNLENLIVNRYLRKEIASGKFGLGYIMNSLRHQQEQNEKYNSLYEHELQMQVDHLTNLINQNTQQINNIQKIIEQRFGAFGLTKNIARKIKHKVKKNDRS